jgi:hypothetical protein
MLKDFYLFEIVILTTFHETNLEKTSLMQNLNKNTEYAETMALKAVQFILTNDKIKENLLTATGILPSDFQKSIKDQEFLAGILDFLLENEEYLIEFCSQFTIKPEEPAKVRQLLPGATNEY